ncbi:hypothetical protein ACNRBH_06500 [Ralstonia pseudosolanacearum]|uniref:hypothetical protein n=1 Tax=Ralstonia pseudosolanacearum TaxID=1310165 RepID=UPI0026752D0E|nr:hypothetical protein [Ralstonia pseudosolanacearum]MDO3530076.1 hypothetical protein [Ralstonia pseudosolanacearum]
MSEQIFEQWLNPSTMMAGEREVLSRGDAAIPILRCLLDGSAKNAYGIPYRNLGLPLRCALEVALGLGERASELEALIVPELKRGDVTAARVLAKFGHVGESTIVCLAEALTSSDYELRYEAANALIQLQAKNHPVVTLALEQSAVAQAIWTKVSNIASGLAR